jgi:hypothetical protein
LVGFGHQKVAFCYPPCLIPKVNWTQIYQALYRGLPHYQEPAHEAIIGSGCLSLQKFYIITMVHGGASEVQTAKESNLSSPLSTHRLNNFISMAFENHSIYNVMPNRNIIFTRPCTFPAQGTSTAFFRAVPKLRRVMGLAIKTRERGVDDRQNWACM